MNPQPKAMLKMLLWNLIMAAIVFLPGFVVAREVILAGVGFPLAPGGFAWEAGNILVIYLILSFPVVIGTVAHSSAVLVLWALGGVRHLRTGTLALAPLLPLAPLALRMPGLSLYFSDFFIDTAIATAAYGIAAGMQWPRERRAGPGTNVGGIAN